MKHRVVTIGRPGGWAREAAEEYQKRIQGFQTLELVHCKDASKVEEEICEKGRGCWKVCLDSTGEAKSTEEWRREWEKWERSGRTKIAWMIGGADGHSDAFRKSCDAVRSLGPQTLSHDLALVVLMEQIYRVESWRAGHPYHRK
ncbi:MAG: 23S rRNA (pseudouridine(1915)-N(3))-methyltransferase RlmH [Verrucomicrobia bacterium]|nr:23S rRNA (pseudouridine(1915)-N(3))-methyltransferase RlmH [Verrucomicrobiota bacterium]